MEDKGYSMVDDREFLGLPELVESWDDTLFAMEQRYPQGVMLHAPTKAAADRLRTVALNAGKEYSYSLMTTVRQGDGDWLVYIAQL